MVASTHWIASGVGMAVLERGGNAFDAAVAAGLTLQVVEPHMNGPGGEVPILAWSADQARVILVAGQGPAPRGADVAAFRALGLDLVPGTGLLPACVPGAFDAWMLLLRDFGTLRLREVMEYAIGYAERGHPVAAGVRDAVAGVEALMREEWTDSAALYLRDGGPPRPGTLLANRALAATWRRLVTDAERSGSGRESQVQHARDAFYRGWVAEEIAGWVARTEVLDTSGRRHRGLLAAEDMGSFSARLEEPVSGEHRGLRIHKTGPWGQGPVLLQALALLDGFDLERMGLGSAEYVHTVVECLKLALADRDAWYGDPEHVSVPLETLLSAGYAAARRALVGEDASAELRPGSPGGLEPRMPAVRATTPGQVPGVGEPTLAAAGEHAGDTCHLDVADARGNLVSATPSGGWLQSSPVIPALGFPLGTRGQMFWLEEGLPNSLRGGKRPRTTLTPSLATRDGEPYLAFGTPGGDQQDQWSLHFLLAHARFGLDLQAAIEAPAFHTNHLVSSFYPRSIARRAVEVEGRLDPDVVAELRRRGHEVGVAGPWALGRLSAAGPAPGGGLRAAANPRGMQGYAVGR
jgi:gamma-glutamyltranspeptidase/glutathione hydrolase